uniref:Uncharacterized protein n=1 Tax=Arundo donax TaxID=35708 RepID=A0A0A9AST8_ARUDO
MPSLHPGSLESSMLFTCLVTSLKDKSANKNKTLGRIAEIIEWNISPQ